jgi:hypothetical protein
MDIALTTIPAPITKVCSDAIETTFDKVRPGDWVFAAETGRRVKVSGVELSGDDPRLPLWVRLDDGTERTLFPQTYGEPGRIAIVPEHGWTLGGAGYRRLESPDEHPRGEFTETCRCGRVFGSGPDGAEVDAEEALNRHADEANGREFYAG